MTWTDLMEQGNGQVLLPHVRGDPFWYLDEKVKRKGGGGLFVLVIDIIELV